MQNIQSSSAEDHIKNMKPEFEKLVIHLKKDASKMTDERAKVLFDMSAEVINGLYKTFSDFETQMKHNGH